MSDIEKLTAWHKSQLGTKEEGVNNVIYNTHYYGGAVVGEAYPWCCTYIWDGFAQLGLSALFCGGQRTAYCPFVVDYAQRNGCWFECDYREGDLLLFDWDGDGAADHIGYCLSWNGVSAETIEGNAGDAVMRMVRGGWSILGAYRPEYSAVGDSGTKVGDQTDAPDVYTVKNGDTLWGIAERELGSALKYKELMALNGLTADTIYPGQKLRLRPTAEEKVIITASVKASTADALLQAAAEWNRSIGEVLDALF